MSTQDFIPLHKGDFDAVARARSAGYPAIAPALPDLLEWLQDMNWPVAQPVLELLASVGSPVVPHVIKALRGDDDLWKYWLLSGLAQRLETSARAGIIDECMRIAGHPSAGEIREEVHKVARDVLILHFREAP